MITKGNISGPEDDRSSTLLSQPIAFMFLRPEPPEGPKILPQDLW